MCAFIGAAFKGNRHTDNRVRYILAAISLSYILWVVMFCIYRYIIPLEMLAPLAIVLAVMLLPFSMKVRGITTSALLVVVAFSVSHGNWGRLSEWGDNFISVNVPPISDPDNTMILMAGYEPYSFVVPSFPKQIPFIRIQSNFANPDQTDKGINAVIAARIAAHDGPMLMLVYQYQYAMAQKGLDYFGLKLDTRSCPVVTDNIDQPLRLCPVHKAG